MSHLRTMLALAVITGPLAFATSSSAQSTTSTTVTTQPQPAPVPAPPPPAQPAPQVVTVQPPPPAATTTTTSAPYPGGDQYAEKTIERRPNRTLLKTGVAVLVTSYVASAIAGLASTRDADGMLLVPLVGPWLDLANRGCDTRGCGDRESTNKAAIATAGIFQTAGALLTIGAFIIPESSSVTHENRVLQAPKPEVRVTPISFGSGGGIGAIGTF